ncbi:MAG: Asp23/Gls24 family envelope stress response protein [Clostridia bacterium]
MKVVSNHDNIGKVEYSSEIVVGLIDCALGEIKEVIKPSISGKNSKQVPKNIRVDYVDNMLFVDVFVSLIYTSKVSEVASKIQSTIKNALETMTEFRVKEINVHIVDVIFDK